MIRRRSTATVVLLAAAACGACARAAPRAAPTPSATSCNDPSTREPWGAGAVSVVCANDVSGIPARQIEEWLQGRVAGLWVVQRRGGFSLLIRGPGSIYSDNEPLYVLDGMPLVLEPGRGLYWLSPRDVQMVEVLKDADATALYGLRGANGVVLITTRR